MPSCLPRRYCLLDLLFAVFGTVAFLGDLGSDVWSAVKYYNGGDRVFAGLHFGLYVLSSCVLQILSGGWFWVDSDDWKVDVTAGEHTEQNGIKSPEVGYSVSYMAPELRRCSVDAVVCVEKKPVAEDKSTWQAEDLSLLYPNGATALQECHTASATATHQEQGAAISSSAQEDDKMTLLHHSCISKTWQRRWSLIILHILQLGYPLRCLHSLEVGIAAYRSSERSPEFNLFQDYAYFLTHDISMMRLVETFLENTPQLILVLYMIIQRETIEIFQYFSIVISFICISWAILDYHQSLRLFLKDKEKLNYFASAIYFLWNFFLISSRIMCITLFALTFHWMTVVHFVLVWFGLFVWVCLQKTDFMKSRLLEPVYRGTVAVILYFSWFNIADGRTIYRSIIYHTFITIDSGLLLFSWVFLRFPSSLDKYEICIFMTTALCTILGLLTRGLYYKCVHPNVTRETKQYYDEPDGIREGTHRMETEKIKPWKQNERMLHLAQHMF